MAIFLALFFPFLISLYAWQVYTWWIGTITFVALTYLTGVIGKIAKRRSWSASKTLWASFALDSISFWVIALSSVDACDESLTHCHKLFF